MAETHLIPKIYPMDWRLCRVVMDEDFKKAIKKMPRDIIADVALVRHGRWIDKGEYAVCTECGGRSSTQYDGVEPIPLMTQFCPRCGAKMDEVNL